MPRPQWWAVAQRDLPSHTPAMSDIHPARDFLADDKTSPAAARIRHGFHRDYVDEVKAAVAANHIVVVGMGQNPVVAKAKKLLAAKGLAFVAIDHGSYLAGYRRRLAIKMWAGFPTFPMVFRDGVLVGGCSEMEAAMADGSFT